jgi:hypothetical protein
MVDLVYLDSKRAGILDNNSVDKIKWLSREAFIADWQKSGGWAFAPVYSPTPPLPI